MRQHEIQRENGFTLIELLVVVAVVGVLAALVTSQLVRARMAANESATIASLRAISTAQMSYAGSCGRNLYADSLTTLGLAAPPYLSPDLTAAAVVTKSGYQLTMLPGLGANAGNPDCNGRATTDAYYASGAPTALNISGSRSFAVAAAGTIWQVNGAVPPSEPFGPPATPVN